MSKPKFINRENELEFLNNEFNKKYNSNHIHRSILTASIGCFYEWCIAEGNFDLKKELKLHLSILFKEFVK